eukprot:5087145-Amphidinium_carterae.1
MNGVQRYCPSVSQAQSHTGIVLIVPGAMPAIGFTIGSRMKASRNAEGSKLIKHFTPSPS